MITCQKDELKFGDTGTYNRVDLPIDTAQGAVLDLSDPVDAKLLASNKVPQVISVF